MNQIRMKLHQFGLIDPERRQSMTKLEVARYLEGALFPELRLAIQSLWNILTALEENLKLFELEGKKQSERDPLMAVYRSVPGFGGKNGREISNELGDMKQFSNERQLSSFTGLTPQEFSTGDNRRLGHISRQGSSRLRALLVEAAWLAVRKDPALEKIFLRIAQRAGKKRAIVAIARRLVCRIRACFRDGILYRIEEAPGAQAA
jgi:transposase